MNSDLSSKRQVYRMASASRVVFFGADRTPSLIYEETTVPEIQDGEILAKIILATICGSDIHTIKGMRAEAVPRYVLSHRLQLLPFKSNNHFPQPHADLHLTCLLLC